jgi:hypothetical protein
MRRNATAFDSPHRDHIKISKHRETQTRRPRGQSRFLAATLASDPVSETSRAYANEIVFR